MNEFEQRVFEFVEGQMRACEIRTIQVNVGLRCNQNCRHCHVEASPQRAEEMGPVTMDKVIAAARMVGARQVDITGGAPELNRHIKQFIKKLRNNGIGVQLRTNLTVHLEEGMEDMGHFLRDHQVDLVASMPCYLEENVRAQRGDGVYERSVEAIQHLNKLGYGVKEDAVLSLVYNPGGAFLPPEQKGLEADYRRELRERYGIEFTRLLTITNMPIGRFRRELQKKDQEQAYMQLLRESFNPQTVSGLMCRHQLSVGWDGTLYDCDFNLAMGYPVDHGAPDHIDRFDTQALRVRQIVTADYCFGCTAGYGSSCGGALA